MSNKILEPTVNNGAIIGTLHEKQLELVKDMNGVIQSIRGSLVIRVGDEEIFNDIEVRYFVGKFKKDGTENPMFDGAYTVFQEYQVGDKVNCRVSLEINDFSDKRNQKNVISKLQLKCVSIRRETNQDLEPEAKINISGMIRDISREMEDNEETGRLQIKFYGIKYNGALNPMDLIVPEELADDFESYYQVGDTVELVAKITKNRKGKVEIKREATFGFTEEADAKVSSGYDVLEYHIFKGYPPVEVEEDMLDPEDVKEAEKERKVMLENLKNTSKPTTSNGNPVSRNNPFLNN